MAGWGKAVKVVTAVTAVPATSAAALFPNSVDVMWEKVDSVSPCPFQQLGVITDLVPRRLPLGRHTASGPRVQRQEGKQ